MTATHARPPRYTKSTLPTKPCATCGRPFAWRKKWKRDWDTVKHCSAACRRHRRVKPDAARKS